MVVSNVQARITVRCVLQITLNKLLTIFKNVKVSQAARIIVLSAIQGLAYNVMKAIF